MIGTRKVKKFIYSNENINEMPYSDISQMEYHDANLINTRVNNSFVQLYDNDKYIENQLRQLNEYNIGPKKFDETTEKNSQNGSKFWKLDGDKLMILRKHNLNIQETLKKINTGKDDETITTIFNYGEDIYVGSNYNLYRISNNDIISIVMSGKISGGQTYQDKAYISIDDDVYVIGNVRESSDKIEIKIEKKNNNHIRSIRNVFVVGNYVFVDTETGLLYASANNTFNRDMVFTSVDTVRDGEIIYPKYNGIKKLNETKYTIPNQNDIVSISDNGVFQSNVEYTLFNKQLFLKGSVCNSMEQIGDDILAATNNGLFNIHTNEKLVEGKIIQTIKNGNVIYCLADNGVDGNSIVKYYYFENKTEIHNVDPSIRLKKIFFYSVVNEDVFIGLTTENKVVVIDMDISHIQEFDFSEYGEVIDIILNDKRLYVLTNSSICVFNIGNIRKTTSNEFNSVVDYKETGRSIKFHFFDSNSNEIVVIDDQVVLNLDGRSYVYNGKNIQSIKELITVERDEEYNYWKYAIIDDHNAVLLSQTLNSSLNLGQCDFIADDDRTIIILNGGILSIFDKRKRQDTDLVEDQTLDIPTDYSINAVEGKNDKIIIDLYNTTTKNKKIISLQRKVGYYTEKNHIVSKDGTTDNGLNYIKNGYLNDIQISLNDKLEIYQNKYEEEVEEYIPTVSISGKSNCSEIYQSTLKSKKPALSATPILLNGKDDGIDVYELQLSTYITNPEAEVFEQICTDIIISTNKTETISSDSKINSIATITDLSTTGVYDAECMFIATENELCMRVQQKATSSSSSISTYTSLICSDINFSRVGVIYDISDYYMYALEDGDDGSHSLVYGTVSFNNKTLSVNITNKIENVGNIIDNAPYDGITYTQFEVSSDNSDLCVVNLSVSNGEISVLQILSGNENNINTLKQSKFIKSQDPYLLNILNVNQETVEEDTYLYFNDTDITYFNKFGYSYSKTDDELSYSSNGFQIKKVYNNTYFDDVKIYDISSDNVIILNPELSATQFQNNGLISPTGIFYDNNSNRFILIDNSRKIWVPDETGYIEQGYVIPQTNKLVDIYKNSDIILVQNDGYKKAVQEEQYEIQESLLNSLNDYDFDGITPTEFKYYDNGVGTYRKLYLIGLKGETKYVGFVPDTARNVLDTSFTDSIVSSYIAIDCLSGDEFYSIYDNGKYLFNKTGNDIKYSNDGDSEDYIDPRISSINDIRRINNTFYIMTNSGIYTSDGYRNCMVMKNIDNNERKMNDIIELDTNRYLIASVSGMYLMINNDDAALSDQFYIYNVISNGVDSLLKYSENGIDQKYLYSSRNEVYQSDDVNIWTRSLSVDTANNITSLKYGGYNRFLIGTDRGLYVTQNDYEMIDDLKKITDVDIRYIIRDNQDYLSGDFSERIQSHISSAHDQDDLITRINNEIVDRHLDNLTAAGFGRYEQDETTVKEYTDLIYRTEFGDNENGDLEIHVGNYLSSTENAEFQYILNKYTCGTTELIIHIPTTNTYYLGHVKDAPGTYSTKEIQRKNLNKFGKDKLMQTSDISSHFTKFSVIVNSTMVNMKNPMQIIANGISLPLKVYRDTDNMNIYPESIMFNTAIKPTKCLTPFQLIKEDEYGMYRLDFACFGTDEQSIKIVTFDEQSEIGNDVITLVFQPNGASGKPYTRRIRLDKEVKLPYQNRMKWTWSDDNEKIFMGWSLNSECDSETIPDFEDGQKVIFSSSSSKYNAGNIVEIYPIWIDYKFTENDTTLIIDTTDKDEDDPIYVERGDIIPGTNLKDQVVIKYDN